MGVFTVFLKETLKKPAAFCAAAAAAAVCLFAFAFKDSVRTLSFAVYVEDSSEAGSAAAAALSEYDIIFKESASEVEEAVYSGEADCGAVVFKGLDEKMEARSLREAAAVYASEQSTGEEVLKLILTSALYGGDRTGLLAKAFSAKGHSLSSEEIDAALNEVAGQIDPLAYEITYVDGTAASTESVPLLPVGVIALALFVIYGVCTAAAVVPASKKAASRFTRPRFTFRVILPRLASAALLLAAACALGLFLSKMIFGSGSLKTLAAAVIYLLLLTLFFTALALVTLSENAFLSLTAVLSAVSLILLPLYWDISLYVPAASYLRLVTPPCWMTAIYGLLP